ncbi:MAG: hypothetical protein VB857_00620, partial [Pirellulaceae bacterium]
MLLGNRKQNRRSNRRQKSQKRNSTERRLQFLETLEDRRLLAVAGCFDEQLVRDESNRSVSPYHATDQVQVRQHRLHRRGLRLANPLLDNKTGSPNGDDEEKKPKIDNEQLQKERQELTKQTEVKIRSLIEQLGNRTFEERD